MLNKPDITLPLLSKPELMPATFGPAAPGAPVLKKPDMSPTTRPAPVAPPGVLKKPDILPLTTLPPTALLLKPETLVPVFPKPEFVVP
jgi:hypothetical protein